MNLYDAPDRLRLATSVEKDFRSLEWVRNLKRCMVESYAGPGYGRPKSRKHEKLVNLAQQTVEAHSIGLVPHCPRSLITSPNPRLTYFAKLFTVTINNYLEEIGLEITLRRFVTDALFGLGVIKLHLRDSAMVQLELDRYADPGLPYASNLPIDNFVFDTQAPVWESVRYAADSYRIAYSELDHPMFDPDEVQNLVASKREEDDRTSQLSRGNETDSDDLEDMIDLADFWFPDEGMIYTFPISSRREFKVKGRPVAVMKWDGSERGPYPILSFLDVPDNIIPASMLASLAPQERLINNILKKQGRQAERQKEITAFPAGSEEDVKRINNTDDGGACNVNEPERIKQLFYGGASPLNQALAVSLMQIHNSAAGNLVGMLGQGAQAPTASQEEMIQGRIGSKGASMQSRVRDATKLVVRGVAQMIWNDRALVRQGKIPIEGSKYSLDAIWAPDDREGSFEDYKFDVFNQVYQSPDERWMKVSQFVTQIYAPLAQQFMQQGMQLDLEEFTNLAAELWDLPQLKQCIRSVGPTPMLDPEAAAGGGGQPANTTRTYERRSVAAGPTPQNAANQQIEQWLAMDSAGTGASRGNAA